MDEVLQRLTNGLSLGTAYVTALVDPAMTIEWISPSVTDHTGWAPNDLVGRSALDVVHPDDLESVARLLQAEARSPHPYGTDPARRSVNRVRFLAATGGWCSFDISANNQSANPDVGGFVFILSDSTEQRYADAVYDALMAAMPLEVIAQRIADRLAWQTQDSLVRVDLDGVGSICAGRPRPGCSEHVVAVEPGGTLTVEHDASTPPSEWFVVLAERAAAMLGVALTRHIGEQSLRRRLDEKTALISAVSHDLRSPIAAIQLMSSLLDVDESALTDDQRRELVQRIGADARRTSRLLADLTSLDRLLHGSNTLALQRVSLGSLVERVLGDLDLDGRTVELLTDAMHVSAFAEPVLTERVVDNLLANALKHTPTGVRVQISFEEIEPGEVVLHIDDDGPGVPESKRAAMFDAYVRGAGSEHRPGSGMGLFLVRTFAEVQGGRATCVESPLGGARFSVTLRRWPGG
jgi:signal transduction histidine kinase